MRPRARRVFAGERNNARSGARARMRIDWAARGFPPSRGTRGFTAPEDAHAHDGRTRANPRLRESVAPRCTFAGETADAANSAHRQLGVADGPRAQTHFFVCVFHSPSPKRTRRTTRPEAYTRFIDTHVYVVELRSCTTKMKKKNKQIDHDVRRKLYVHRGPRVRDRCDASIKYHHVHDVFEQQLFCTTIRVSYE